MKPEMTMEQRLNKRGRRVLLLSFLTLLGAGTLQIVGTLGALILRVPVDSLAFAATNEVIAAGTMVLGIIVLGGVAWLRPSREDVSTMLHTCWPILVADAIAMGAACVAIAVEGAGVSPDWLPNLGITVLMCLGIGVFEEFMYRGIILNGMLAVAGKTHRGTMVAVAVTSVLFGLAHVDVFTDFASPLLAAQAILKIVQTGLFSVLLCAVVLRTHRLGGASLFHGLSDCLLMVPSLVLVGESMTLNYVSAGEEGVATIVIYCVIIAFYLPLVIRELRRMHRERVTYRGAFMEHAAKRDDQYGMPVPPARLVEAA